MGVVNESEYPLDCIVGLVVLYDCKIRRVLFKKILVRELTPVMHEPSCFPGFSVLVVPTPPRDTALTKNKAKPREQNYSHRTLVKYLTICVNKTLHETSHSQSDFDSSKFS